MPCSAVCTCLYAVFGRLHLPSMSAGVRSDTIVLQLPARVVDGIGGDVLTAMLAGGAFAALLSTASGLAMSVTGVLHQEFLRCG
jgi:cation/acetate symporter